MAEFDRQAAARMREAFEALPLWPREVFYLHRVERLDYVEIGRRLGIGVAAVEARLAEAIQLIDRHLREADARDHARAQSGSTGAGVPTGRGGRP